jgi:hypothetical protein
LGDVLACFPDDEPLRLSVQACRGLRLLRQDPWECLASFILSSTKQIVQIRQIIELLCRQVGEPVAVPASHEARWSFPAAARLALADEFQLRACKMGFRAKSLLAAARRVDSGELDLAALSRLDLREARTRLMTLPGVGPKTYATANGTASAGMDYQSANGVLTWGNGDAANKSFSITILDDGGVETAETFTVTLSNATGGAALGTPLTAQVTITDDDAAVPAPAPPSGGGGGGGGIGVVTLATLWLMTLLSARNRRRFATTRTSL